jgi:hypothetical protein
VEVGNHIHGGSGLGHRIAAAWADAAVENRDGSRSIAGANADKSGHARENHRPRRPRPEAPDPGGIAITGFQDDRGTALAPALKVEPATPDVYEAGKIPCGGGRRRRPGPLGIDPSRGDGQKREDAADNRAEHCAP